MFTTCHTRTAICKGHLRRASTHSILDRFECKLCNGTLLVLPPSHTVLNQLSVRTSTSVSGCAHEVACLWGTGERFGLPVAGERSAARNESQRLWQDRAGVLCRRWNQSVPRYHLYHSCPCSAVADAVFSCCFAAAAAVSRCTLHAHRCPMPFYLHNAPGSNRDLSSAGVLACSTPQPSPCLYA